MPKLKTDVLSIQRIVELRKTGHSLPEIAKITGKGKTTVFKYIKGVEVRPQFHALLKAKQGGSKERSMVKWDEANALARKLIGRFVERDKLIILASLYWGEGAKNNDLSLNNSDPFLIKVFIECLKSIGVKDDDFKINLRVYEDIDCKEAVDFWSNFLNLSKDKILGVNVLNGKKIGKLKYGMCRVRVRKGSPYFKLIISMISLIKSNF